MITVSLWNFGFTKVVWKKIVPKKAVQKEIVWRENYLKGKLIVWKQVNNLQ